MLGGLGDLLGGLGGSWVKLISRMLARAFQGAGWLRRWLVLGGVGGSWEVLGKLISRMLAG